MTRSRLTLPRITQDNRARALLLGYLLFCTLYLGSYALSYSRAIYLQASWLDLLVPTVPASLWVYLSQFVLLPLAFLRESRSEQLTQTFHAMIIATLLSCAVFLVWPTTVGRPIETDDPITAFGWYWLYFFDVPGNCFPSLHVALALLAARLLSTSGRIWMFIAPLWASAIAIAVLTTRQHRASDIAGGIIVALISWQLGRVSEKRAAPHSTLERVRP